jgi:hypothetical protein
MGSPGRSSIGSPWRSGPSWRGRSPWRGSGVGWGAAAPYWRNLGYTYPIYNNWSSYYPSLWYDYYGYDYLRPYYADQVIVADAPERGALLVNGQCVDTDSNDPALVGNAFFAGQTCANLQAAIAALPPPPGAAAPSPAPSPAPSAASGAAGPLAQLVPTPSNSTSTVWMVIAFVLIGALFLLVMGRK